MLPFLSKIIQRWFGGVVDRDNVLEVREHGSHKSLGVLIWVVDLVVLEKLFDRSNGRILMTDDVVEGLNNAFVMVSEEMRVGVRWRHPETPIFVHLRVFTGEDGFSGRCRDPDWGMREGVIHPDDEVGVEFRRNELIVHCLVLAFLFAAKH
jgi:hypothetical protein